MFYNWKKSYFLFPFDISNDQDDDSTNDTTSSVSSFNNSYSYQRNIEPKILSLYQKF